MWACKLSAWANFGSESMSVFENMGVDLRKKSDNPDSTYENLFKVN